MGAGAAPSVTRVAVAADASGGSGRPAPTPVTAFPGRAFVPPEAGGVLLAPPPPPLVHPASRTPLMDVVRARRVWVCVLWVCVCACVRVCVCVCVCVCDSHFVSLCCTSYALALCDVRRACGSAMIALLSLLWGL